MASDKLSSIQEPLLNLDLDVQNEATTEIHSLELTREDLKNLISSLEGANRVSKCVIVQRINVAQWSQSENTYMTLHFIFKKKAMEGGEISLKLLSCLKASIQ